MDPIIKDTIITLNDEEGKAVEFDLLLVFDYNKKSPK